MIMLHNAPKKRVSIYLFFVKFIIFVAISCWLIFPPFTNKKKIYVKNKNKREKNHRLAISDIFNISLSD